MERTITPGSNGLTKTMTSRSEIIQMRSVPVLTWNYLMYRIFELAAMILFGVVLICILMVKW